MSTMTCRDCGIGPYGAQPSGLFLCDHCGHLLDLDTAYFDPAEVVVVDTDGNLLHFLSPYACLSWMDDIRDLPTGDWALAMEALGQFKRAAKELEAALRAGLPYTTPA
ncbi:hypothetical protein [Streptomyces sp. NPDC057939]|uniref:hypothetical protein n=1 Tax=Streptomyces sp. NPDC057939 TaxID=3346284 RepID=UPI0036E3194E